MAQSRGQQGSSVDEGQNIAILALSEEVSQIRTVVQVEMTRVWTALGGIAGLDGLAVGMAQVAEVLAPLRQLVPPVTYRDLDSGVDVAMQRMRVALGLWAVDRAGRLVLDKDGRPVAAGLRALDQLPVDAWSKPVAFIGQP